MPISIIVEDGTDVPNANSYVSVADARDFFIQRGLALPVGISDDQIASALLNAMDYFLNTNWIGIPQYDDQSLDWPRVRRVGCYTGISNIPVGIPNNLKQAQMRLAFTVISGVDLFPVNSGEAMVTEETIGPITTKYAAPVDWSGVAEMPLVDNLLESLIGRGASIINFRSIRA